MADGGSSPELVAEKPAQEHIKGSLIDVTSPNGSQKLPLLEQPANSHSSKKDNHSQNGINSQAPEHIHLISNEMFIRDEASEAKAPELVSHIPHYQLENFLKLLPLAQRLGEIKENRTLNKLGFGNGGFVFQFKSGDKDLAIKLLYGRNLPQEMLHRVMDAVGVESDDQTEILGRYSNQEDNDNNAYFEAGGFELGHGIAPEYVDKPECIFTLHGVPIGLAMPTIYGEGINIGPGRRTINDPNLDRAWNRLVNGGVGVDTIGDNNAIKYKDGDIERVKFVDLEVVSETLENDPRKLRTGEFWVGFGQETRFMNTWLDYKSIVGRINSFNSQYNEVVSGERKYTFEDVLEGIAYKTNQATYQAYKEELQQFSDFVDVLKYKGIIPDRSGVSLRVYKNGNHAEVNYAKDAWLHKKKIEERLSQSDNHLAQEFRASYDNEGIGRKSYEFHSRLYHELNRYSDIDISFKNDQIVYKLAEVDGEKRTAKILNVDALTGGYKYYEGEDVGNPNLLELSGEKAQQVLEDMQLSLGLNTLSVPETTLSYIYEKMK